MRRRTAATVHDVPADKAPPGEVVVEEDVEEEVEEEIFLNLGPPGPNPGLMSNPFGPPTGPTTGTPGFTAGPPASQLALNVGPPAVVGGQSVVSDHSTTTPIVVPPMALLHSTTRHGPIFLFTCGLPTPSWDGPADPIIEHSEYQKRSPEVRAAQEGERYRITPPTQLCLNPSQCYRHSVVQCLA